MRLADRIRLAVKVIPAIARPARKRPAPPAVAPTVGPSSRRLPGARRSFAHTPPVTAPPDATGRAHQHRIDAIDVWSVTRVAVLFYFAVIVMIGVGIGVAWLIGTQLGAVSRFEEFMQGIGFQDFEILSGQVVLGMSMVAAALVTTWVVLTIAAAALYNAVAVPWGGVHMTLTPLTEAAASPVSVNGNGSHNGNGNGSRNGDRDAPQRDGLDSKTSVSPPSSHAASAGIG
jgi:hypothetical protein